MSSAELEKQLESQLEHQFLETIPPEGLDPELVKGLPLEFLKKQCAIPIRLEDGQVAIALADPLNVEAYDAILSVLAQPCRRVVCPASEIEQAVSRCYYQSTGVENNGEKSGAETSPAGDSDVGGTGAQTQAEDLLSIANKAPIIKLVNKIFFQAVQSRASDIHVEPYENEARVRFRIDGVLHNVLTLPKQQTRALLSRLKIMSNLDIAERRLPQDGHSRIKTGQDLVDVRVSVIPTLGGERAVLRLLDKGTGDLSLAQIGFGPDILERFRSLIRVPHGIILLTGPTGSGKTTTLYAALNELNSEERNILTVEDPIEYQLPGIGQMQVKPKINLTFANCLRHILRQDPDVIMVGEIRDLETAEIAIQASLTGHLVLSTLHTNDSASAVTRLLDMGIEPYLISSSVIAVMAQRLLRLICPSCKSACQAQEQAGSGGTAILAVNHGLEARATALRAGLSESERALVSQGQFYKGLGCDNCLKTGYFGRTGIFELLVVDDEIRELIIKRRGSHIIKEAATGKGMSALRADGLRKALAGQTTLDEVCRVTQDVETNIGAAKRVSA
jgi:general secretion pathway protein E